MYFVVVVVVVFFVMNNFSYLTFLWIFLGVHLLVLCLLSVRQYYGSEQKQFYFKLVYKTTEEDGVQLTQNLHSSQDQLRPKLVQFSVPWFNENKLNHGSTTNIHQDQGLAYDSSASQSGVIFPHVTDGMERSYHQQPSKYLTKPEGSKFQLLADNRNSISSHSSHQLDHFIIREGFTLPMPQLTLPIHNLIKQQWMKELKRFLHTILPHTSSPISIASSDSKYKEMLLNWLISATIKVKPPLSHVLVLSLDQQLHRMLVERGLDSLYVNPSSLLSLEVLTQFQSRRHMAFRVVMVLRLTVMRLMNHWGYDTANYDIDAIMLHNPEKLYYTELSKSDLIGSQGKFPESVKNVFGITLCAGVFMIKSTPETG